MIEIKDVLHIKDYDSETFQEFCAIVLDVFYHPDVQSMHTMIQHGSTTTLEHTMRVSYNAFRIAKVLRLQSEDVARAAILHDFFLYDWHDVRPKEGLHGFVHARIALQNAEERFELSLVEKDIILKHMWPLNLKPPRYMESFIVTMTDKYCSLTEIIQYQSRRLIRGIKGLFI